MTILHIDFESFSACDLPAAGLHNYAVHPTTGVHCMAFAFDDEPVSIWIAGEFCYDLTRVFQHVRAGGLVYAHNAPFELNIWNEICVPRFGWQPLDYKQVRCTMAMCYAMGMPGALENAAPALGVEQRKDAFGKRVMMQLAKPREDGSFITPTVAPEKFEQLYSYCKTDVEVERALHHRLMELPDDEQLIWQIDYEINQRGVAVDLPSIDKAIALVEAETRRLNAAMLAATGGAIASCSEVALLGKWIRLQGVDIKGVAKSDVLDALGGDLPDNVRAVLHLRKEAAKSSTAKLIAMKNRASPDGRVRGTKQYHGAATGRWAGRGMQTDNFPRPRKGMEAAQISDVLTHLDQRDYIDMMYGPVLDAMADTLRSMIVASEGCDLIAQDFSAIEARVLAWLAGEQKVLDIFQTHGKIYEHAASGIFHVAMSDVTYAQRQVGKVAILALGYGGGVGAFQTMAKGYNVKVPDAEADEIKTAWRNVHPKIVRYWYALEDAAIAALREGGVHKAGALGRQVAFKKSGSFLWCQLPSGRVLCYPYPEIRQIETPWGAPKEALTYMTELDSTAAKKRAPLKDDCAKGRWQRISTYGGSLAENVTQAVAADLLRHSIITISDAGYPIVMHVHDEIVVEIESVCDDSSLTTIEHLMSQTPPWAAGLPVSAEGWRAKRYRK